MEGETDACQEAGQKGRGDISGFVGNGGGIAKGKIPEQTGSQRGKYGQQQRAKRREGPPLGDQDAGTGHKLKTGGVEQEEKAPFGPDKAPEQGSENGSGKRRRGIKGR